MYWQTQDFLIFFPRSCLTDHFCLYYIIWYSGTPYYTSTRYVSGYLTGIHSETMDFQPFCCRNGFQPQWLSLNLIYQMW